MSVSPPHVSLCSAGSDLQSLRDTLPDAFPSADADPFRAAHPCPIGDAVADTLAAPNWSTNPAPLHQGADPRAHRGPDTGAIGSSVASADCRTDERPYAFPHRVSYTQPDASSFPRANSRTDVGSDAESDGVAHAVAVDVDADWRPFAASDHPRSEPCAEFRANASAN